MKNQGRYLKLFMIQIIIFVLVSTHAAADSSIPSSRHAQEVFRQVMPGLTRALKKAGFRLGNPVYLRIFKMENILELWIRQGERFQLFRTYPVCSWGQAGLGPKLRQGDGRAPEGFYYVAPAGMNPHSKYHLAFNLGYPNKYDRARRRTGSALMVHGSCVSIGCYAMTDRGIEEIYTLCHWALQNGQPFFRVHIFPFRMTAEKVKLYRNPKWAGFWKNLKQGYDAFEKNGHIPPDVDVKNKTYVFGPPH